MESSDEVANRAFQSLVIANLPEGIVVTRASDEKIVYASPKFEKMFGYNRGELVGKPISVVNAPTEKSPEETAKEIMAELKKNKSWRGEIKNLKKDGTPFWSEASISTFNHPEFDDVWVAIHTNIESRKQVEEKLRESEERYRSLAEAAYDMIFVVDKSDRITYVNMFAALQFGTNPENLIGKIRGDLFPPEIAKQQRDSLQRIFETGQPLSNESPLKIGGKDLWISNWLVPLRDKTGNVTSVMGISRDITDRKHAEDALRESEEKYRLLFNNILDGFAYCQMVFDANGKPVDFIYLEVNDLFEKLTELKNVVGKKVTEVIPEIRESNPELFEIYGRVAKTGKPERFETGVPSLGIWFSVAVYSPKKDYFIAVFNNITVRKKAEAALKESEERYRRLVDLTPDGIAIHSEGKIVFANDAAIKILGAKSLDEVIGKSVIEVVHPDYRDIVKKRVKEMTQAGLVAPLIEEKWIKFDGQPIDVEATAVPFNFEGKTAVQVVFHDITQRKKLEEELKKKAENLEKMNQFMIGREVKMVQLKKELSQLKTKS